MKKELVISSFTIGEQTMSSRVIAEVTGKEHSHVLRDIRNMFDGLEKENPHWDSSEYQIVTLPNGMTKEILLSQDLSLCLATGYSVNIRMKLIKRWRELETGAKMEEVLPQTYSEALRALADTNDRLLLSEQRNTVLEPRSKFFEQIVLAEGLLSMEQTAKLLNIKDLGRNNLFKALREGGVLQKDNNSPLQHYMSKGYFELKEDIIVAKNIRKAVVTTYVTQKGLAFLFKFFGLTEIKNNEIYNRYDNTSAQRR